MNERRRGKRKSQEKKKDVEETYVEKVEMGKVVSSVEKEKRKMLMSCILIIFFAT